VKKISYAIILLLVAGCSSSNNPEAAVNKYIKGFINADKKAIWEASSDDYLNDLLSQTEKSASFLDFSKNDVDSDFPYFNKHIHFSILSTNMKHETHADLLVEIRYATTAPYVINRFQSATKIHIKVYTKRIGKAWSIDKVQLEEILEYNREFDMLQAEELIEREAKSNISNAINSYRKMSGSYAEYFENLESIYQNLELAKQAVFNREKNEISSGNYMLIDVRNSSCSNSSYGSYIRGEIANNFSTTILNVTVQAEFRTYEYSESGWDCNSMLWESKYFTKYITVNNILPGKTKSFEEFFEVSVRGKAQRGYCFGSGTTRTVSIKEGSLNIAPYSADIQGLVEN
jgi:hypothetical protein